MRRKATAVYRGRAPKPFGFRPTMDKAGWVYLIETTEPPYRFKIGFSCFHSVYGYRARVQGLLTGSPVDLRCVGIWPGVVQDEWDAKTAFVAYHRRGEWFEGVLTADVAAWITEKLGPPVQLADHDPKNSPVKSALQPK